jgi:hypothetical protein
MPEFNPEMTIYCSRCGAVLLVAKQLPAPDFGASPDEVALEYERKLLHDSFESEFGPTEDARIFTRLRIRHFMRKHTHSAVTAIPNR